MIPLDWKFRPPTLSSSESTGRDRVSVLAGDIHPDDHGESGLLLHSGSKEVYVYTAGDC